jgi:hypothetical protein
MGVLSSVYSVNVIFGPLFAGGSTGTLSHRRLTESLSVMYLNTICSHVGLSKTAHFENPDT